MTTRSFSLYSAAVLLLAMTLTFTFSRSKRQEPYRQSELRSGRRKSHLQSIRDEEDRQVLAALMRKGGDEELHGADVKGHSTDNRL